MFGERGGGGLAFGDALTSGIEVVGWTESKSQRVGGICSLGLCIHLLPIISAEPGPMWMWGHYATVEVTAYFTLGFQICSLLCHEDPIYA